VARLLATLQNVAEARLRYAGRRALVRASLIGGCVLGALLCLGFALAAITVALADAVGIMAALAIMAIAALVLILILLTALSIEARRHRARAARRSQLDREFYRTAALSMMPSRAPSRPVIGLGLVALGALLVLARRD
jgi:hypothetical protein